MICGTGMLVLVAVFYIWSLSAPKEAMAWPRIALTITFLLAVLMMALAHKGIGVAKPSAFEWRGSTFHMMVSAVGYIVLLNPVGFPILTPVWGYAVFRWMGYKNRLVSILVSLVITALVFYIFKRLLYVPVPLGILSELIY